MLEEIKNSVKNVFDLINAAGSTEIADRLQKIENRLNSIDRQMQKQTRFVVYIFILSICLSLIAVGFAIQPDNPSGALILIISGVVIQIIVGIVYVFIYR